MEEMCPTDEELAAYIDGSLSLPDKEKMEHHLIRCKKCRHVVAVVIKSKAAVPDPPSR